jgi:hypothetical protein
MAYNPSTVSKNLTLYLNQWVKIASGDRVKLTGGSKLETSSGNSGYLIFKCSECHDNWHVGLDNFYPSVSDPAGLQFGQFTDFGFEKIPSVLTDWVKKHRHVCKQFKDQYPPGVFEHPGVCQSCKWPYGAHEESWIVNGAKAKHEALVAKQPLPCSENGFGTYGDYKVKTQVSSEGMKLQQFTGRKFRDVEETCESTSATGTKKTSTE